MIGVISNLQDILTDIQLVTRATGLSKPAKAKFCVYLFLQLAKKTRVFFSRFFFSDKRIEISFVEDFGIFCSSTCVDFVELKIGNDMGNTGYRICCYDKPDESLVSAQHLAVIIFRTTVGEDVGFKLKFRKSKCLARFREFRNRFAWKLRKAVIP
ncbi:unnamed protein product [Gongylonema pulchrum]|uniref:ACT domain-containing protein n=1 Tax=Gongylonema pulchrum TaxID=637853 RepID=A0A183DFB8_9BILA|nr:unnamed protein product [Gongylonema pulchrum]